MTITYKYFGTKKCNRKEPTQKRRKKNILKSTNELFLHRIWKFYVLLMCLGLSIFHHIAMCSHSSFRMSWQKMTTFI